jgi:hypothetical protein
MFIGKKAAPDNAMKITFPAQNPLPQIFPGKILGHKIIPDVRSQRQRIKDGKILICRKNILNLPKP